MGINNPCTAWQCCGLCDITGRRGQGSRSIDIGIGRNFYYTRQGGPPVTIMIREGVTQVDLLLVVLYGITLVPLAEELRAADLGLLSSFYKDDVAFDGLERQSAQLLKLLMKMVPDQGYLPEPEKSIFISDTLGQEEAVRR